MITVPKIQIALRSDTFKSTEVCAPNIFLWPPFESDFVRVTKAGYAIEYEIKLSKSDFRADFKKKKQIIIGSELAKIGRIEYNRHITSDITKHEWLLSGKGATEFYYVFPKGLIDVNDVPEWAGIIEVDEIYSEHYRRHIIRVWHTRKARRLNKEPLSEVKKKDLYVSCYYRYWDIASSRNNEQILML